MNNATFELNNHDLEEVNGGFGQIVIGAALVVGFALGFAASRK